MRRYQSLLAGKVVVVLTESSDRAAFIAAGRALLADPRYAELAAIVSFADSSPELDVRRSYYPLDGHLNPTGHAQEAAAVVAELRHREVRFRGR